MKIAFIGGRDVRLLGGIENYMFNLATQLVLKGHEPIVFCESDHNEEFILNGFHVVLVKGPKSRFICKPWVGLKATVRSVFREKGVRLIHYNAWPPSLWCWIPRLFGIPSLMEGHGLEWKRTKYDSRQQRIMKAMEKFTARLNQNLLMCSEEQVDYFREEYGRESFCVPGGVNLPIDNGGVRSDILERYALKEKKYFLFLGRLTEEKNADCLVKAFCARPPIGYKLVIAGGNDADPEHVEYLRHCATSDDVVFTGPVYGEDKASLLKNAFHFCIPSSIEGLSIVLMEAMVNKVPIIASSIRANQELLGNNAIYVEPEDEASLADAINKSLSFDFSLQIQENFDTIHNHYLWERIAEVYLSTVSTFCEAK